MEAFILLFLGFSIGVAFGVCVSMLIIAHEEKKESEAEFKYELIKAIKSMNETKN